MNYPIIFKLLSVILSTLALAFLASLGVEEFFYHEEQESVSKNGWFLSIAIATLLASFFMYLGRKANYKIFRKEALCVIGLGWVIASIIGALPYALVLEDCSFADAVFESTSGLTTTGATVFSKFEHFPPSLLFWRSLSQWIGGLGVVVFFVAILSFLGAGGKILYSNEASAHSTDMDSGRIQDGVLHILILYAVLSLICSLVFLACGMDLFDAICHMFTTISTGGFSPYEASIAAFNSPLIEWMTIIFMVIGGMNFFVILKMAQGNFRAFRDNTEVITYCALLILCSLIISGLLYIDPHYHGLHNCLRAGVFQVASIMTTTGFTSENYELWFPGAQLLLLFLMILGGCSGSTSGGAKIIRIVIALKLMRCNIERSFRTRVVRPIHINKRSLDKTDKETVSNYLILLLFIALLSMPIIGLMEYDHDTESNVSALVSCFFNIGPGLDKVGPTDNYSIFKAHTKYFLSLLMIMGRLELYAILVLFSPSLWKRFS